jgi:hypothetical protein
MQTLNLARACRLVKQQLAITELTSHLATASDQIVSPVPEEELSSTTHDDIPHRLLKKLCRPVDVEDHATRYSDAMCDCAFALHAISPKAYGFARQA